MKQKLVSICHLDTKRAPKNNTINLKRQSLLLSFIHHIHRIYNGRYKLKDALCESITKNQTCVTKIAPFAKAFWQTLTRM